MAFLAFFTLLLSYIYSWASYYNVVSHRKNSILRAHRNQKLSIHIVIKNRGRLPIHYVFVRDITGPLAADKPPNYFFGLAAGEVRELQYAVESRERGMYAIGPLVISSSDPLGFFPWDKRIAQPLKIIIYPRVLPLQLANKTGLPAGTIRCENKIYEDVTRYRSLKEYEPGDDTRRINWKVSARMGDLYCMEFLPALTFPVLIFLNLTTADYPLRYRSHCIERAVETAASLVYYFIALGQEVGLVASGHVPGGQGFHSIPIRGSFGHAVTLLECLAIINQGAGEFTQLLFGAGFKIPYRTRIVVVGPPLRDEQIGFLEMVDRKGSDVELFQISVLPGKQQSGHRFPRHMVKDYGEELIQE